MTFDICDRCVWPRQCRRYEKCGRIQMLTNSLDAALARNDSAAVAKYDARLKKLEPHDGP